MNRSPLRADRLRFLTNNLRLIAPPFVGREIAGENGRAYQTASCCSMTP
jgi:hypothetical protein